MGGGWVGACMHAEVTQWVRGCLCFNVCQFHLALYVSVSLSFVWLSMRSNLLLCYWFLWEYLCSPWFCLIKSQCIMSHQICTINSMCVGMCRETWEYVCVRLHIHPNLHTVCVHACVCVCAGNSVSARTDKIHVCGHVHENLWKCVCASDYTSILIYRYTVYVCVWVCVRVKINNNKNNFNLNRLGAHSWVSANCNILLCYWN